MDFHTKEKHREQPRWFFPVFYSEKNLPHLKNRYGRFCFYASL